MDVSTLPLLIRHPSKVPDSLRGGVVAIGNFDGVHLGHRHLLGALREEAGNRPRAVVSFYPHPVRVLTGDTTPRTLSSLREKRERFGELGIQLVYGIHFTRAFATVTASEFIEEVFVKALQAYALVVGEDVAIGHKREGNLDFLRRELPKYGISLRVVPTFSFAGERPSSRRIREFLLSGDVQGAGRMLGDPFTVSARVGHGDKRGTALGFPTANVMCGKRLLPKRGVYACRIEVDGCHYDGVANIGTRPTFRGVGDRLEAHVIGHTLGSLYGKRIHVSFIDRIRDEKKFSSVGELQEQIAQDITEGQRRLRDVS